MSIDQSTVILVILVLVVILLAIRVVKELR